MTGPAPGPGQQARDRWAWRGLLIAALPIAAIIVCSSLWADRPIAAALDSLHPAEKQTVEYITWLGEAELWLYVCIPGAIVLWAIRRRTRSMQLAFIAASIGAAGLGVNLLKIIFGRYRPGAWFANDNYGFEWLAIGYDSNSFPSGHAMVAGALAASFCLLMPRLWRLWVIAGVIVGSTRLFTGSHYLSDVVAGLYLGPIVALAMHQLFRSRGLLDQRSA